MWHALTKSTDRLPINLSDISVLMKTINWLFLRCRQPNRLHIFRILLYRFQHTAWNQKLSNVRDQKWQVRHLQHNQLCIDSFHCCVQTSGHVQSRWCTDTRGSVSSAAGCRGCECVWYPVKRCDHTTAFHFGLVFVPHKSHCLVRFVSK